MRQVKVLLQDVETSELDPKKLTNDCMLVIRKDGLKDIVKSSRMVDVFDLYHDLGISIERIDNHFGFRNPKFESPEL